VGGSSRKIEVYNTGIDNYICLNVYLKTGIKFPVNYFVNKNMRLSPSIHVIGKAGEGTAL